ncbi:Uu.00g017860.m01.CDS01 [Anthostomella pinea]|uniref:Uu.00g017860.m01.CDS01 n=1 Tax=Anthostomella pinea TaxID=933095 RepID=A0AAI8YNE9_9PEZI|nr:Uu.00g017860.m01.CDS01 [Anthostomella pinea]
MELLGAAMPALVYLGYVIVASVVLFVSYRLTLHPLSAYPGPIAAKLTDFYNLYHAASMDEHVAIWRNHQAYGPVIRHGPNKLVFNSLRALQDIYYNDRVTKSNAYLNIMQAPNVHSVFTVIDKQQHRAKRRLIGQALNEHGMRLFEPIILEQTDIFIEQLSRSCTKGAPIYMSPRLRYLTLDIVTLLAFGYPLHTQTEQKNRFVSDGILRMTEALQILGHIRERRKPYRSVVKMLIGSRMTEDKDAKQDLYSMVADQINTGGRENIPTSDLWAEAIFLFAAGSSYSMHHTYGGDTTATVTAALFFYLSRAPDCYSKLAREIRTTFDSRDEIRSGPKLTSCRYLRACIDEALRMSPPAPRTPWRQQSDTDDAPLIIDGHAVPRGTHIGVNVYSILHNDEYFPDPFAYTPERWLSGVSEEQTKIMHEAFVPFSAGTRIWAGKAMAYLETSVLISKTLWHFDFEKAPGKVGELGAGRSGGAYGRHRPGEFQIHNVISSTHEGPNVVFHTRASAA